MTALRVTLEGTEQLAQQPALRVTLEGIST
jgi:hypothetical protein